MTLTAPCAALPRSSKPVKGGAIGLCGLGAFFDNALFSSLPVILETLKKAVDYDRRNLNAAREILTRRTMQGK